MPIKGKLMLRYPHDELKQNYTNFTHNERTRTNLKMTLSA